MSRSVVLPLYLLSLLLFLAPSPGCGNTSGDLTDGGADDASSAAEVPGPGGETPNDQGDDSQPASEPTDLNIDAVLEASWQVIAGNSVSDAVELTASAFAIDEHRLATNAHVAFAVADVMSAVDGTAIVVQNETGTRLTITRVWAHPEYTGDFATSPDVGVIEVDGILPSWLQLGQDDVIWSLDPLDEVALCGFPGDVAAVIDFANLEPGDDFRPRASCYAGAISALRPFDPSVSATPFNSQLVQHDIGTTAGTSGSPVLDSAGRVIAVHAATTADEGGTNRFAARVDTLQTLIDGINSGELEFLSTAGNGGTGDVCAENGWYGDYECDMFCRLPDPDCTDVCVLNGWYGDGECDTFCPLSDPDCGDDDWFDVSEVLNGAWVLVVLPSEEHYACMTFNQGVLLFHNPLCWVNPDGSRPNNLDFPAEAVSDGQSMELAFSFTIINTWDVALIGSLISEDEISVSFSTEMRGDPSSLRYFAGVLIRLAP